MQKKNKVISIIASFRNEEENIEYFVESINSEFKKYKHLDYKLYFINDYSTDRSEEKILKKRKKNKKIVLVNMSKNYGGSHSIHYGFEIIPSDCFAVVIDCDLQDPVSLITKTLDRSEKDTLYHFVRKKRYEKSKFQILYTLLAYKLISLISLNKIVPNSNFFKLIPPNIIRKIKKSDEIFPYWNYFISKFAHKQEKIFYSRKNRKYGYSKFNFFSLNPWITFYSALNYFKINSYILFITFIFLNYLLFKSKNFDHHLLNFFFQCTLILQLINLAMFTLINLIKKFWKRVKIKAKIYN